MKTYLLLFNENVKVGQMFGPGEIPAELRTRLRSGFVLGSPAPPSGGLVAGCVLVTHLGCSPPGGAGGAGPSHPVSPPCLCEHGLAERESAGALLPRDGMASGLGRRGRRGRKQPWPLILCTLA